MSNVLLIIQLIISIILTGLILIQRSEGGALGIGGGGGGGLMSGRSATTSIARMTGILGAVFLLNCLALAVVYQIENKDTSVLDAPSAVTQSETAPAQPIETPAEAIIEEPTQSETAPTSPDERL